MRKKGEEKKKERKTEKKEEEKECGREGKKREKERNGYIHVWWGKNGEGKRKKKKIVFIYLLGAKCKL